jgi:hypothetical protein
MGSRAECSSTLQAHARLLQALLRRDYAVGYVLLSWLLRSTWVITPAIALLLGMPHPAAATGAARAQLPAALAWLLQDAGSEGESGNERQRRRRQLLEQLVPGKLRQMHAELLGPAAAVASYASFARACQMLDGAPVTALQVRALVVLGLLATRLRLGAAARLTQWLPALTSCRSLSSCAVSSSSAASSRAWTCHQTSSMAAQRRR